MKSSAWYMDCLSCLVYWKSENCAGGEFSSAIFVLVQDIKISGDSCCRGGQLYRLGNKSKYYFRPCF